MSMEQNENKPSGRMSNAEIEIVIDNMIAALPMQLKMYPIQAKCLKAKFDSLVTSGFTDVQALHIISSRPLWE